MVKMSAFEEENNMSKQQNSLKIGLIVFVAFCFALGAFVSGLKVGQGAVALGQTASIFNFFNLQK